MIISSSDLLSRLSELTFPAAVLAERDNRVMARLSRQQLREMASVNAVVAYGSRSKIKHLRMSGAVTEIAAEVGRTSWSGGTKYTYSERVAGPASGLNQLYTLKRAGEGGHYEHWADDAGFTPGRFNPDAIPAPLMERLP